MKKEKCWKNKFHPTLPQCKNLAVWKTPNDVAERSPAIAFMKAVCWCKKHKQDNDIKIARTK